MRLTVRFSEPLWRAIGERRVELSLPGKEASIAEVIDGLEAAYPQFRAEWGPQTVDPGDDPILGRFLIFVGDRLVQAAELPALRVGDGADVMLVSPMAGG